MTWSDINIGISAKPRLLGEVAQGVLQDGLIAAKRGEISQFVEPVLHLDTPYQCQVGQVTLNSLYSE